MELIIKTDGISVGNLNPLFILDAFVFFVASLFGSFFNVCIYRIPQKKSIAFPPSHCPNCKAKIKPWHNIPIFSYLFLGGKCHNCKAPIHWHYLLTEILTPTIILIIFIRFGHNFSFEFWKYSFFFAIGIIIFFIDYFHKIIPNILSLPLILIGIILSIFPNSDISFRMSLIGAISGFSVFFLIAIYYEKILKRNGMGWGDIKYITAIGAFLGPFGTAFTIFSSSVIALILLVLINHDRKKEFPFGPFLVIGSFIFVIIGNSLLKWYLGLFQIY